MRRLVVSLLCLPLLLLASCGSILCPDDVTRPAAPGTYLLAVPQTVCTDLLAVPMTPDAEQHQLTLSADKKKVLETWVRNGKTYTVEYDVVGTSPVTLMI